LKKGLGEATPSRFRKGGSDQFNFL
jgi:hypothetical protein